MGIFGNLFGKSDPTAETLSAEVYMKRGYVNQILVELLNSGNVIAVTFFSSTKNALTELCRDENAKARVVHFTGTTNSSVIDSIKRFISQPGNRIVLAERYPLQQKETELVNALQPGTNRLKITAYCALDDSIIMQFGGERITSLMIKLGMAETECISHDMVTASIVNAQKKTSKKVSYEQQAKSPEEWYRLNLAQ